MGRPRKTYDERPFRLAVDTSDSWRAVHLKLGLSVSGGSYQSLRRFAEENDIDFSHFKGRAWDRKEVAQSHSGWGGRKPMEDLLVEHSNACPKALKARLIRESILTNECAICETGPEWFGKPLVLQLDHINGVSSDNRLKNLRILCPNCHTQTGTWGMKSRAA